MSTVLIGTTDVVARAKKNFSALAFLGEYTPVIKDVWTVLDRPWSNLAFELGWALEAIPAGEHGKLKIELTDAQRTALVPLLAKMPFFRGCELRGGKYDELHVTGAKFQAMVNRIRFVRGRIAKGEKNARDKVEIGRWVGMFGQRPRTDWQDGKVEEIYANLSDAVKQHPWVIAQMELEHRLRREIIESDEFAYSTGYDPSQHDTEWRGAFATEFELGILAFIIAYDGDVRVGEYVPSHEDLPELPGVPKHMVASCTIYLSDGTPVVVLNAPAVIRAKGAPRPTTDSGTQYWLKFYAPVKGARIVCVSGKTHWYRVIGDYERRVHNSHPDALIFGMSESAGANPEAVLNNALAELVWLMQKGYNEIMSELTGQPIG